MAGAGGGRYKQKDSPQPPTFFPNPAWENQPYPTLFPKSNPPPSGVLTPNIMQTDDRSHYCLPCRSKCLLSQLLIGSDAWERKVLWVQEVRQEMRIWGPKGLGAEGLRLKGGGSERWRLEVKVEFGAILRGGI